MYTARICFESIKALSKLEPTSNENKLVYQKIVITKELIINCFK